MPAVSENVLSQFAKSRAVIMTSGTGPCPVFARGDRRTVATHWLSRQVVREMESDGTLVKSGAGLSLSAKVSSRLLNPVKDRAFTEQHGPIETREIYTPSGAVRTARVNTSFSSLRRIAAKRGRDGQPALPAPLVEAGERFTRDFHALGGARLSTQNYSGAGVDGGSRHDGAARKMAHDIDSAKRLSQARKALGPKLEKVIIAVCCNNHDLAALECAEGWAKRSGGVVLKLALETLRDHYGTQARS